MGLGVVGLALVCFVLCCWFGRVFFLYGAGGLSLLLCFWWFVVFVVFAVVALWWCLVGCGCGVGFFVFWGCGLVFCFFGLSDCAPRRFCSLAPGVLMRSSFGCFYALFFGLVFRVT